MSRLNSPHLLRSRVLGACAMAVIATGLAGCLAIGGTRQTQAVQPTLGEQLVDLKKALDCGAITQKEYDTQKCKLLGS